MDEIEIALVKAMSLRGFARDHILSFFVRPGRIISPAVVSEVFKARPDVLPAEANEVESFIARRLSQSAIIDHTHGFGPTSELRVREVLQLTIEGQVALPGFESHFAELKTSLPSSKSERAKIAKTLVSFTNNQGGYVFFGISNDGRLMGIPKDVDIERIWDELSDVITGVFTPFFQWDRSVVNYHEYRVGVAYAHQAVDKPIIASSDFTSEISSGQIFFRYNRSSEPIKPGDLLRILHERDKRISALHSPLPEFSA